MVINKLFFYILFSNVIISLCWAENQKFNRLLLNKVNLKQQKIDSQKINKSFKNIPVNLKQQKIDSQKINKSFKKYIVNNETKKNINTKKSNDKIKYNKGNTNWVAIDFPDKETSSKQHYIEILTGVTYPLMNFGSIDANNSKAYFAEPFGTFSVRYSKNSFLFIQYQLVTYRLNINIKKSILNALFKTYQYEQDIGLNINQNLWMEHGINIGLKKDINIIPKLLSMYVWSGVGVSYLIFPQMSYTLLNNNIPIETEKKFKVTYDNIVGMSSNAGIGFELKFKHIYLLIDANIHYFYGLQQSLYQHIGEYGSKQAQKLDISNLSILGQIGCGYYLK